MAHSVTVSAGTGGSRDQLWALVSDVDEWPRHLDTFSEVTALQPGTARLGARYRLRQPGLPAAIYTVTRWVDGEGFVWKTGSTGLVGIAEHWITGDEDGVRLTVTYTWTGPLALAVHTTMRRRIREMLEYEAETFAWLAGGPGEASSWKWRLNDAARPAGPPRAG